MSTPWVVALPPDYDGRRPLLLVRAPAAAAGPVYQPDAWRVLEDDEVLVLVPLKLWREMSSVLAERKRD